MVDIKSSLSDYLLVTKKLSGSENEEKNKDVWDLYCCVACEDNWKIFFDQSFDKSQLKIHFSSLTEDERIKIFKFGISCIICFVQINFTGPDFSNTVEDFLKKDIFEPFSFHKLLSVNNEDINVNTKSPSLLVVSKLIFECCPVDNNINNWWYWRSILIHQQILDELSPTLRSDADRLYKHFQVDPKINGVIKASLDIEVAQLYLLFRHVSKAKDHILAASALLGVRYDLVGILGKRTKYQEKELAQLSLKVTLEKNEQEDGSEGDDHNVPKNISLNDDTRLDSIELSEPDAENARIANSEQKLFINIVQEMLIAKPQDELQTEELQPFVNMVLKQKNSYAVRIAALLLRCKLEMKNKRTVERSLSQCEEIINSFKKEEPPVLKRIADVFATGMPPIWKVEKQHADLLLNLGLVKNALDIFLKIKRWEEVIVCYTILELKHKAAEIIQEQLKENPSVKLWCLLGDATEDVSCYEKAWELSKRRSHRAQRHWGNYLFVRKQYEECIPHFEKSVSINPLQSNVWSRLGFAALQIENWQTAATAYRRYTNLEPDGFEAWNNLAQAYIKIGNKRNAHQAILEALKCNFDNWKVWENLLLVSCDISNISDVIRAYHRLLDLKGDYINVDVLNVLVYNVCNNVNDCEGQPSQRFLQKTRELLGRVNSISPSNGYIWELYANLAPSILLRAQRLQRAYRGYTQGSWDKDPKMCKHVLYVCVKLAEIVLESDMDPKDTIINSIRLNISSAITAIKKHEWEDTRESLTQVSALFEKILGKVKMEAKSGKSN
ncbi:tetratricopeptide repeat protein 27 [Leptinotarsa decemlineata]|uniref:tetratricopeptide repeat protein 27 n=1 Tax=Leptinotarsa decemlineata TaxID=7539 RepID=UPI003D305450